MIKAIIFDFGGVFDQQHEALSGFLDAAQRYNIAPQAFYDLLYSGEAWKRARIGAMTGHDYWHSVMVALGHAPDEDVEAFRAGLFAGRELDARVVAIARRLAQRFPLALLSNATDELESLLEHEFGIHGLFTVIVNSARVGVAKPDPRAYHLALDGLHIAPDEALFIDDKPRNVRASEALGIPTIHYTTAVALEAELVRRGLLEATDSTP